MIRRIRDYLFVARLDDGAIPEPRNAGQRALLDLDDSLRESAPAPESPSAGFADRVSAQIRAEDGRRRAQRAASLASPPASPTADRIRWSLGGAGTAVASIALALAIFPSLRPGAGVEQRDEQIAQLAERIEDLERTVLSDAPRRSDEMLRAAVEQPYIDEARALATDAQTAARAFVRTASLRFQGPERTQ